MNKKIRRPNLNKKVIKALGYASSVLEGNLMIMTQYDNDETYFDTEIRPQSDNEEVATLERGRKKKIG